MLRLRKVCARVEQPQGGLCGISFVLQTVTGESLGEECGKPFRERPRAMNGGACPFVFQARLRG